MVLQWNPCKNNTLGCGGVVMPNQYHRSPAERELLRARISNDSEKISRLLSVTRKCEYCGSIWYAGKRQHHRENCNV